MCVCVCVCARVCACVYVCVEVCKSVWCVRVYMPYYKYADTTHTCAHTHTHTIVARWCIVTQWFVPSWQNSFNHILQHQ